MALISGNLLVADERGYSIISIIFIVLALKNQYLSNYKRMNSEHF